jgi:glutamate racemase
MNKIGVFDSGVGGQSVVNAIHEALPELEIIYVEDKENVPYGNKSPEELHRLVLPILQSLVEQGCEVIVIACNTVTTTIISKLREELSVPLVGMEPMIKPAVEKSKSGRIAICATPATLASERYKWLKDTYAKDVAVLEPDCSDWAFMIESNQVDHQKLRDRIVEVCEKDADTIVLGCTHYHWIEEDIQKIADEFGATVIQPEQPVIEQLKRVLEKL